MTAGGHNRKVTPEQRHQLVQVYLHMGLEDSRALCVEYGVSADYAAKRASAAGLSHKRVCNSQRNERRNFWSPEKRAELTSLAATGMIAADIGAMIGTTRESVVTYAGTHKIAVVKNAPELQAVIDLRAKERQLRRQARDIAAQKSKIAERAQAMSRGNFTALAVQAATSKTSKAYRLALPSIGEMSKSQLRAMIAEAAANTASLQTEASA